MGAMNHITVASYLELWLAHVHERVRATTYEGYECLLRCHVPGELEAMPLSELTPLTLQHIYTNLLTPGEGGASQRAHAGSWSGHAPISPDSRSARA